MRVTTKAEYRWDDRSERYLLVRWEGFQIPDNAPVALCKGPSTSEQNIATNQQPVLPRKETKTARAMPRHVQNLEIRTEEISIWGFLDQKIRLNWFDFQRESEVSKEIAIGNHRRGQRVTSDLAMKLLFNSGDVLDVIDVPVC